MQQIIFVVLLIFSLAVKSKQATMLTFGYAEFPPYTYTNKLGQPDGTFIKQVGQILSDAGYRHTAIPLPTKRLMKLLATGEVDIWLSIDRQYEYNDIALVGQQVVGEVILNLYSINQKAVSGLQDLNHNTVIIIRGYHYGGALDYILDKNNHIKSFVTQSHESAFNMLSLKRADYLLAYQTPAEMLLQQKPIDNIVSTKLSHLPFYFVVSKQTPRAETVLQQLEAALPKH